jgi:type IV pilus assembly protein PilY1
VQQTITQLDPTTRTVSNNPVDWSSGSGWYVDLNPGNVSPGERVNLDPQLVLGTLVVASNIPSATACTVGGESWIYQFNYATGSYVATAPSHIVATKLPGNTLAVGMVIVRLPSGQLKVITTGAAGNKETLGVHTGGGGGGGRKISWRELIK